MAIQVIYKGDDTDFRGSTGFTLKVVTSSNLNLSGCTVEVEVLGFRRSFPASATGELVCPFAFTAAETQRMPLGIHAATVRVYDSKGRVRTINNSIRVKVTNSVHEAYGKDDPQEVTLAVSTVDLGDYAKKAEVTKAIAAAMKDASASVKLHALTPEVTDTTVTLKPVDGAANYVDGKVEVIPIVTSRSFRLLFIVVALITDRNGESVQRTDYFSIDFSSDDADVILESGEYYTTILRVKFKAIKRWTAIGEYFNVDVIANDSDSLSLVFETELSGIGPYYVVDCSGFSDVFEIRSSGIEDVDIFGAGYEELSLTQSFVKGFTHVVALPASTDSAKARRFTLAVETDAETEKAVEWQGGEVIEALPGASKLLPGLTVWDVAEVAPGKFRVDRASSPAQSVPLTLTSPSGRVAELTVGDDLVLEVKEK